MKAYNIILAWRDALGIEQTALYPIVARDNTDAMKVAEKLAEEHSCAVRSVSED